ncbi:hypothetical protein HPB49_005007 [Dermacentor silvarum]|uniref:Uncharacterized protein n=1 Tax=Dermacentor silvarum TaxID=543639 RepID=A0ACB8DNH2_DERSI|nr:hypothetical protein HPB49_005007 [Dermacentor silvarum]
MGRTNLAITVFRGTYVPHYVYYRSYEYQCVLYKKQYETCYACRRLGHRADLCPQPQVRRCRGCGSAEPTDDNRCEPKCLLCGRDHPTGDRKCKVRFKTPYLVKKRQWERKLQDEETLKERQRSENANRDADGAGIKKDDFPALDDGRQHRSRSRSRSGAHSRSRSRELTDPSQGPVPNPEPGAGQPPGLETDHWKRKKQKQRADTPDRYRRAGQTLSPAGARGSRLLPQRDYRGQQGVSAD